GAISTESASATADGASISKGVPTSGFIPNGAIVEKEIDFNMNSLDEVKLALRNPDITTASNIASAINGKIGRDIALVSDPGTVKVMVPDDYKTSVVSLLHEVEQVPVETDQVAKIIIDEASGTVVMGENVKIDTVAIAQGNLTIKIKENPAVSQPNAFAPE